jgi:hypothetical protein
MFGKGTLQHSVHLLLGMVLTVYGGRAATPLAATGTNARKQEKIAATLSAGKMPKNSRLNGQFPDLTNCQSLS